jgi:hypothetical protein
VLGDWLELGPPPTRGRSEMEGGMCGHERACVPGMRFEGEGPGETGATAPGRGLVGDVSQDQLGNSKRKV